MIPLRHSTANQHISLGYFLDSTDGNTEETAATISVLAADIRLWKHGLNTIATKNSGAATPVAGNVWKATFDGIDSNTLGPIGIFAHPTGALAVELRGVVLAATVFDALITSGSIMPADVRTWQGSTVNALIAGRVDSNIGISQTVLQAVATSVSAATIASIQQNLATSSALASTLTATVSLNTVILADVARWRGQTVLLPNVSGVVISDPNYWRGSSVNELIGGKVDAAASSGGTVTVSSILGGVIQSGNFAVGALINSVFAANALDTRSVSVLNAVATSVTAATVAAIQANLATSSALASTLSASVSQWRGSTVNALIAGRVDSNIGVSQTALLAVASSMSSASISAIWDESLAAHQTVNTAGRALILAGIPIAETTVAGVPSSTSFQLTAGTTTDGFYDDMVVQIVGGSAAGQTRVIATYTGATRTCAFDEALAVTPSAGDAVIIRPQHVHPISDIQSGLATSTQLASTLTATISGTVTAIVTSTVNAVVSSTVNANITKINSVTVTGTGTAGNEWGP